MGDNDKVYQKGGVNVRVGEEAIYVVDGVQQVDSSQSGGSVTQKGRRSADVVGDVFFNPLLENNLQYMQDNHRTYQAIRQYRIQQLKRDSLELTERVAPAKIVSPFAEAQKQQLQQQQFKNPSQQLPKINHNSNNNNINCNSSPNFGAQRKQSPRSLYEQKFSDSQCQEKKWEQQRSKLNNKNVSLLVKDSVGEMNFLEKEQKVLQWVFTTDEQLYWAQNGEECSDWITKDAQNKSKKIQKQKCTICTKHKEVKQKWWLFPNIKQMRQKQKLQSQNSSSFKTLVTSCFGAQQ
eukprot:TRINITY_DN5770_c0_g1_i1.p1 TRINITY_DN5770_c0_g1~~TRINITY_DN5770_c0_g1_i1.p1  ORF type:complete len:292 (+),score=47.18 TRINITY_DN5770_c0_g1_i1:203-1078(+)